MRSCGKSPQFVEDNGHVLGVSLPADFCAEHEWGIEKLHKLFGIKEYGKLEGPCGLERRQATVAPSKEKDRWGSEDFLYEERNGMAALTVGFHIFRHKPEHANLTLFDQLPHDLELKTKSKDAEFIHGAWCEDSFGLIVKGEKNIEKLRVLRDQIESVNVAVFLGGGGVFDNPGLVIAFVDCFPSDAKEKMKKTDEDRIQLYQAAEDTGIEKKICENLKNQYGGKPYYALSPSWKGTAGRNDTKHKVIFWLNPQDQQNNNYGWFTVEELEQWIEGKGPIPMKKKEKTK